MQTQRAAELAWGVGEIAEAIERDARATYHLLSTGRLPARKVGGKWVASRSKLREFFLDEDRAA